MINIESALSFIALVGLYLLVYHAFSGLFLESGRQKLFGIRDHIFDYSLEHPGKLSKESHEEIRDFINKAINSLEYITVLRVLVVAVFHRSSSSSSNVISNLYSSVVDQEAKAFIKASMKKSLSIIIRTMLLRAPLTSLILVVLALVVVAVDFIAPIQKKTKAKVDSKFKNTLIDNLEHAPCA